MGVIVKVEGNSPNGSIMVNFDTLILNMVVISTGLEAFSLYFSSSLVFMKM